jgi:hypothetical protein
VKLTTAMAPPLGSLSLASTSIATLVPSAVVVASSSATGGRAGSLAVVVSLSTS